MIIETFITTESEGNGNGLNLVMYRCDDEDSVCIKLVDHGEKPILPFTFEVSYQQLMRALLAMQHREVEVSMIRWLICFLYGHDIDRKDSYKLTTYDLKLDREFYTYKFYCTRCQKYKRIS